MQRIKNDTGKTSIESRLKRLRKDMKFARSQQYNYLQTPSKFLVEIFKMIGVCQSDFQQILYFWRVLQILNKVLGMTSDCFLNRQSDGFCREKVLLNGTIEINWYLPRHSHEGR